MAGRLGRFVLQELEKRVTVTAHDDLVVVESDLGRAELTGDDFVEATVARLPETHPLEGPLRTLLSTVP